MAPETLMVLHLVHVVVFHLLARLFLWFQPPFTYSRSSDAYMFGVLLWEIFVAKPGEVPWGPAVDRRFVTTQLCDRGVCGFSQARFGF
jgi:hypothetical protein